MSLLVVGSVALDSVQTPHGSADEVLGGSATYFSCAASYFTPVRLVGVVGEDFPREHCDMLARRNVDLAGLEFVPGKTFRWCGRYELNMNDCTTLDVQLNVLGQFEPKIPAEFRDSKYVFLANCSPRLQMNVLSQMQAPKLVVADTMNLYIENERDELIELMGMVDGLILNDSEALQFTGKHNLVSAAREILSRGLTFVVIKKGEHGAMLADANTMFCIPAFPLETVVDPTGAGDSFAGGMMGYLAKSGTWDAAGLRKALVYGTVVASFNCEGFSLCKFDSLDFSDIEARYRQFEELTRF